MEFFLQQEGSFGTILFFGSLLAGLLYLILPIFAWRIWFWSRQNNKHLQKINTNLELLIREIAPEALPAEEAAEKETAEMTTDAEDGFADDTIPSLTDGDEESFFAEDDLGSDFSDDEDMDFALSGEFDDMSDELANSEISDFTGETFTTTTAEPSDEDDSDDELIMDFDDEPTGEETTTTEAEVNTEEDEEDEGDFGDAFTEKVPEPPAEIPVAATDSSDFTVEHFESNEETSFEFEDVDDSFGIPADNLESDEFLLEDVPDDAPEAASEPPESPSISEPSAENIWGDESTGIDKASAETEAAFDKNDTLDDFSFGAGDDLGSAFDEPPQEKESVGDTANSFLSDLEGKLNLDSLSQPAAESATTPEPLAETPPEPKPEPEPTENQSTLFARCEGCGHKLAYKQALSGKRVRCPACRTAFSLP